MKHIHVYYAIGFLILFGVETLIALFVHDGFVRPYLGDVIVMPTLYCLLRTVLPLSVYHKLHQKRISWWICLLFVFAVCVEVLQGIHIVEHLGLSGNAAARTVIGTSFEWADLICYFAGCLPLCAWEWFCSKPSDNTQNTLRKG